MREQVYDHYNLKTSKCWLRKCQYLKVYLDVYWYHRNYIYTYLIIIWNSWSQVKIFLRDPWKCSKAHFLTKSGRKIIETVVKLRVFELQDWYCWDFLLRVLRKVVSLRLPLLQNYNFSKCAIWSTDYEFFYFVEKSCSVLKIFKFLYFQPFHDLPNQWHHDEY